MEEEDEVDVLGEFNLENFLTKTEDSIPSCYDGDHQLGLHCESQWVLDATSQGRWYENKSDPQQPSGGVESDDPNTWTDKERYLLEKGLELFGRSWSRLAQYIGTKNANQVKSYVKSMGIGCTGNSTGSFSSFGTEHVDVNSSELINDMDIPASMEEVIAMVSTAQPTVVMPTSEINSSIVPSNHSNRKWKNQTKKNSSVKTIERQAKRKKNIHIYNAEDIKEVLIDNKERDHIVLPSGEEVIRIRYGTSTSEDSDVDIDVDSDLEKDKDELIGKENDTLIEEFQQVTEEVIIAEESFQFKCENSLDNAQRQKEENKECFVDMRKKEESGNTAGQQQKCDKTQVFKGDLVTPSGKILTVVVDDMLCKSNNIDQCHNNTSTNTQPRHISQTRNGDKNKTGEDFNIKKQSTVSEEAIKSSRAQGKKLPFDVISGSSTSESTTPFQKSIIKDKNRISSLQPNQRQISRFEEKGPEFISRFQEVKAQVHDKCVSSLGPQRENIAGEKREEGCFVMYADSDELLDRSSKQGKLKGKTPVKLIHCKTHSNKNKAPFRVELAVSALILVDVHSHLSPECEVMGLLGGSYRPQDGGVLSITLAVPCHTIHSSSIHCDMCPVSQLESSVTITDRGLSVVGWYHSHPEFDPSPSDTDIDTQKTLQTWFNKTGNPFVGFIFSPYFSSSQVSSYRCCHVVMDNEEITPYNLQIRLTIIDDNIGVLKKSITAAYNTLQRREPTVGFFRSLKSIRNHLRKASLEEDKVDEMIKEIHMVLDSLSIKEALDP